jgi:hypothetical protein
VSERPGPAGQASGPAACSPAGLSQPEASGRGPGLVRVSLRIGLVGSTPFLLLSLRTADSESGY